MITIFSAHADIWQNDNGTITSGQILEIPDINADRYEIVPDVAQYKLADWSNLVGRAKNVTVAEAKKIADENPAITFFFYMKGYQMVLENNEANPPYARVFHQGDAVFFSGKPWWGSAPGYSDGYIKKN